MILIGFLDFDRFFSTFRCGRGPEMSIQVVGPPAERAWRFAGEQETGEQRLVTLLGTELVAPPSPSLPPVSRSRPTYFINVAGLKPYVEGVEPRKGLTGAWNELAYS